MKRFVDERKQVKQQMKIPGLDENKRMQVKQRPILTSTNDFSLTFPLFSFLIT
jgi:hypothetical protein